MAASNPSVLRRSSRVKMNLPILVTSTEPQPTFSEVCETMMVNAHGCSLRANNKLDAGSSVQFQTKDSNWTMAHIVDCQPLNHGRTSWMLGAKLDKPTNFWGLENYPEDWAQLVELSSPNNPQQVQPAPLAGLHPLIAGRV